MKETRVSERHASEMTKLMFVFATVAASVAVQAQSINGDLNRATPCNVLPTPPGNANGIEKMCPPRGSSTGIAKGDFNHDGIADLAIGISNKDLVFTDGSTTSTLRSAGAVQIVYGTADHGLVAAATTTTPASQLLTAVNPLLFPTSSFKAQNGDAFGSALAAGDFNGDGFTDLAVALPNRTSGLLKGAVMIFLGSSNGLIGPRLFLGPETFLSSLAPSSVLLYAATSLTWGDFNGDGRGDLAVATTFTSDSTTYTPGVTVLFGVPNSESSGGLTTVGKLHFDATPVQALDNATHPSLVLSAGDFNGDGVFDLVAGSPFENTTGAVHVLYGVLGFGPSDCVIHSRVLTPQLWKEGSNNIPGTPVGFAEFGGAFAAGDFNGDGFPDLAIGAPGDLVQAGSTFAYAGSVTIIYGSTHGLQAASSGSLSAFLPSQRFTELSISGLFPTTGDNFGAALAANDFNGDRCRDLAIGAPGNSIQGVTKAGVVAVIYGSSSGLSTTAVQTPQILWSALFGFTPNTGEQFGLSLTAWDFGRGTQADLAIGVPFADVGAATGAGSVFVVYGSLSGLTGAGLQLWTENSPGLHNSAQTGDHFGLAVY